MPVNTYHQTHGDAPAPPATCPVRSWDPLGAEYLADPYPTARSLREETPVFFTDALGYLVVTRMEDIVEVFMNPDVYASVNVQDPLFPLSPEAAAVLAVDDYNPVAVMSNRPEPDHTRIRVYTREGFSRRRLRTLEPYIVRRAHELIDAMVAAGPPAEFIAALAFPLPGETVFRFIGFPEGDDELLKQWCGDRKTFSWGHPTGAQQVAIAQKMLSYWRYCREFTAHKRDHRGDDFASELLDAHDADPDDLTYNEVESIIYGLSFAGHEAVTALIANCLLCLLPRRDAWEELSADLSLIPNAVEEVLRYESSQVSWRRITTSDTTLAGCEIPKGTRILLNFASANRQPDVFDGPDTFDIHRANASRHISFGKGIHYCLGANLAKLEAQLVLAALGERLPSLRLVAGQTPDYFPNITFRGPDALLLEWDA
jgi:cytochrome P450